MLTLKKFFCKLHSPEAIKMLACDTRDDCEIIEGESEQYLKTLTLNVSVKTLQRWDNAGILKAQRSPTGRRCYTEIQYLEYIGQPAEQEKRSVIIYARVSSSGQKDDLKNQVTFLREYANAKGIIVDEVLTDIGSGLNFKRRKWNELLTRAQNKEVGQILIAHKDRFIRFGFDWYRQWLSQSINMLITS